MKEKFVILIIIFPIFFKNYSEVYAFSDSYRTLQKQEILDSTTSRLIKIRGLEVRRTKPCTEPIVHSFSPGKSINKGLTNLDVLKEKKGAMFSLIVKSVDDFQSWIEQNHIKLEIHRVHEPTGAVLVECSGVTAKQLLEESDLVIYLSLAPGIPNTETSINYMDLSVNRINTIHSNYPELTGQDINVLIKEQRIDSSDIDLQTKLYVTGLESEIVSQHANFMATMIGGKGNSYHLGLGVARDVLIGSTDFTNIYADESSVLIDLNVSVQNHSYGFEIENSYGVETQSYDHQAFSMPTLLHVFSAGNKGLEKSDGGPYANIEGYANLSGSVKMAKNTLTIGATDNLGNRDSRSSGGPTHDGRVKPDVIAYGREGTSDAAALGTGLSVLIQDWYLKKFNELPNSSFVKSAIIGGAVASDGQINFREGYGVMNGSRTMKILNDGQYAEGAILKNQPSEFELTVPENIAELHVVICWTDPPAEVGSNKALINDLDLSVVDPENDIWRPWVLNHYPHVDSLAKPPIRMADHINNVELVTVSSPSSGVYSLMVNSETDISEAQTFSLAYWLEEKDNLVWTFPTSQDVLLTGSPLIFRWDTNLSGNGKLEIKTNNGWQSLSDSYDLSNQYFEWEIEQPIIQSQLRITTEDSTYYSDEFNIVEFVDLDVGYHCENKFKLIWEKDELANKYRLFELVDGNMTLRSTTTDTSLVFDKSDVGLRFAIQPVYHYLSNYKSRTIDYTQQGVYCYFKSFVAELVDDTFVRNSIQLTSLEEIESVDLFNWHQGQSKNLTSLHPEGNPVLVYEDEDVMEGVNNYFATIKLLSGDLIFTDSAAVYYARTNTLLAFPNPIAQNSILSILSGEDGATLQLLNSKGELLHEEMLFFDLNEIEIGYLSPGLYILRLFVGNREISYAKLIVSD